jgi:hypothetical protein
MKNEQQYDPSPYGRGWARSDRVRVGAAKWMTLVAT